MPATESVSSFLTDLLREFDVYHSSSTVDKTFGWPYPSLRNPILPMFTNRWATGKDQHTKEIFGKISPALQLASRFLSDPFPLRWFTYITFARHCQTSSGTYLTANPYSLTPQAVTDVQENLAELGKVITFMFAPHDAADMSWGTTYRSKSNMAYFNEYKDKDWPRIESCRGAARPCVVMRSCFDTFFHKTYSKSATQIECYRALLVFTVTLVHEVAHAYWFWLGGNEEPLVKPEDKHAELGYSWETCVMGRVLNPVRHYADEEDGRFYQLCSVRMEDYGTTAEREQLVKDFSGHISAEFTTKDAAGQNRKWPLLDPRGFRGAAWYLKPGATAIVAGIYAIPSTWVVRWFQEEFWVELRSRWERYGEYRYPAPDEAFMICYERNFYEAWIVRPLNPAFKVDREILRHRAREVEEEARKKGQYER